MPAADVAPRRAGRIDTGTAAVLAFLGLAAAVGLWARLAGLGSRQLALDEYYFVRSIRAIVDTGAPAFQGGGLYVRGLLPQYVTAAFVAVLGDNGLAYRLPSVLFNLGAVGAAYVYARSHLPRALALLLPALLLLSSWEVEFARFARMYAAFQLTTLLLLVVVGRALKGRGIRWIPVAVLATVLSHALGVLFVPVLAMPAAAARLRGEPIPGDTRQRVTYAVAAAAVAALALALVFVDFRNLGVSNPFPPDFVPVAVPLLRAPALAAPAVSAALLAAIGAALGYRLLRSRRPGTPGPTAAGAWAWAGLGLAAVHSLPGVLTCLLVVWGRFGVGPRPRSGQDSEARRLGLLALAVVVGWTLALGVRPGDPSLERALLGWPNLYDSVVKPWASDFPLLGLALAAGLAVAIGLDLRRPLAALLGHPATPIVYAIGAMGVLETLYPTTRYLFFLYPAALLVLLLAAARLAGPRPLVGGLAVVLIFAASGDFQPRHLADPGGPAVSHRTGAFARHAEAWYPRPDYRGPAEAADSLARADGGRTAIVVYGLPVVSEYLDAPHAHFLPRTDERFGNVSRSEGTVELWSGQRLISTADGIREWVRDADRVLVVSPVDEPWPEALATALGGRPDSPPAVVGADGRIGVRRLP